MISEADVKYIASLSRIHLKETEIKDLTKSLESILHYVRLLEKLDVQKIPPTSHVLPLKNVYREDVVTASLPHSEVMKIAADKHEGSFKVPKVIE